MSDQNPPPRPGNYERSWNDPPLFSYGSANQSLENAKKPGGSRLNKRVEFPSSGISNNSMAESFPIENKDVSCPPISTQFITNADDIRPPPINSSNSATPLQMLPYDYKNTSNPNKPGVNYNEGHSLNENEPVADDVAANFDKILEKIESNIDKKKHGDVKKRIDMMTSKWKSGAFNPQIHIGMDKMTKCLMSALGCLDDPSSSTGEESNVNVKSSLEEAENIQKKLMVDWPSMCGTWMVGIKHLIQEIRRILLMNGELIETREEKGINMPL